MIDKVLVTGAAGFIGYHLSMKLMQEGAHVVGIDNMNDYYDIGLKISRKKKLIDFKKSKKVNFNFKEMDINEFGSLKRLFKENDFNIVVNLAAQAGVRYSINSPFSYGASNLSGFLNILECCRAHNLSHFIFASSSSVYGLNDHIPFSEEHKTDHPISLYAATKKSNEVMAHAYSHLYKIPTTGLRFFTVYGPFGRPDMAYYKFTKAILEGNPIHLFNNGVMKRDFTYIDDIIESIFRLMPKPPTSAHGALSSTESYFRLLNIGNNQPVKLSEFIKTIERSIGKNAKKVNLPMQPGDVPTTFADIDNLVEITGYRPKTTIQEGINNFVKWYKNYFGNAI
tara:strand:+ start:3626 stop:4642 length:1017 start_codon:yes stop_codon:yes gene_type:complete